MCVHAEGRQGGREGGGEEEEEEEEGPAEQVTGDCTALYRTIVH
eukprot:COSAG06_NODE_2603_length_6593_cov_14.090699_5_plen_44_part_00